MAITEQQVQAALKELTDPNTGKDYVTGKEARNIKVDGNNVSLDILLGYPAKTQIEPIRQQVVAKLKTIPGVGNVAANVTMKIVSHAVQRGVKLVPNVKNIIAVANQVDSLTSKDVRVVPTCSMPEALAALVSYDPEATAEANAKNMTQGAQSMATGEVTQAVRDTKTDAGAVHAGDWIGLVRSDGIVAIGKTEVAAAKALLDHLITSGNGELLTIITGADATAAMTAEICAYLAEHHSHVEVEVHSGGQPLYPFLFGVE